jgi:hypothetical protein
VLGLRLRRSERHQLCALLRVWDGIAWMVLGCLNMVEIREDRTSSWSVWNWWYWLVGIVGWPCRIGILLALGRQTTGIQRRWVNGLCCNWFPLYVIPAIRGCFFVQLLCISWVINRGHKYLLPLSSGSFVTCSKGPSYQTFGRPGGATRADKIR